MHRNDHGMMSDSLQDLDRELSLLRRKRELIEEQQQLLNRPIGHSISPWAQPNERDYNNVGPQQRYMEHDVVNMYDSGRGFNPRPDARPDSRKRPADTQPWEPPKRFRPPRSRESDYGRPRFNERSAPKSNPSGLNQRPRSSFPPKPVGRVGGGGRGGAGAGVARGGGREARGGAVEARGGAGAPQGGTKARSAVPPPELDKLGAEPTPQQQGRLELALGDIYGKVRADHKGRLDDSFFLINQNGKTMKQEIRSRIKSVLVGKPIGTRENILAAYWKAFPDSHDIVRFAPSYVPTEEDKRKDKAKERAQKQASNNIQEACIDHLRSNGVKMLECQLDAMFKRLEKIYEEEAKDETSAADIIKEIIKAEENPEMVESTDVAKTDGENTDSAKIEGENTDVVKTDGTNGDSAKTEAENTAAEKMEGTEGSAEKNEKDEEVQNRIRRIEFIYEKLFSVMFKRKVTTLLPKHRGFFIKIISSEMSIKEGEEEKEKRENKNKPNAGQGQNQKASMPKVPLKDIPYFVAVIGRPKLPKRAKLSDFLWQFSPLSIKKHRNNYNILFMGLGTKKDFDNVLAKSGEQIAGCQIIIKPSEKMKKETVAAAPATEQSFIDDVKIIEDRVGDHDGDVSMVSISSEMEDKIDDLLSSVMDDQKTEGQSQETELLKDNETTSVQDNAVAIGDQNGDEKPSEVQEAAEKDAGDQANETGGDQVNETEGDQVDETEGDQVNETEGDQTNEGQEIKEKAVEESTEGAEVDGENEVKNTEGKVETPSPVRATRRTSRLTQNK